MKKATLILPFVLLMVGLSAYGVDLKNYGFDVTNTRQENNQTIYTIATPSNFSFTVASSQPLTAGDAQVLQSVMSTFSDWKSLKIAQAKAVFNNGRVDILVVPSSFVYRGVDLSKYMPSGMQFYYDKYLQYDFRMLRDNLFLRLKGQVYDEKQFADRLYTAVENPVLFLQTNNPEYLLERLSAVQQKLDSLTSAFDAQKKAIAEAEASLAARIDSLSSQGQRYASEQAAANAEQERLNKQQQELNKQQQELNKQQQGFNREQERSNRQQASANAAVQKELAAIKEQNSLIASELDHVRYSLLVLNNRGFFGKIYPIDRRAIDRVVAMKKAEPSLTQEQVMAKLKAAGIKMSKKEVSLVFGVYFNEFK